MNLDKIIKESIDEFLVTEIFGRNKYANLVKTAIMRLESCLLYPQVENINSSNAPQSYVEMASVFNTGHTLANQLMNCLKQIQNIINQGKNVKESRLVESPSIGSLIPSGLRSWNPVRDFAVGARKGMRAVDKMFNKNKGYKTYQDKMMAQNTYASLSDNIKSILDGILGEFQESLQNFYKTYMSDKDLQQQLARYATYITVEFKSCYKLIDVANNLRYSGIEKANFNTIKK